MARAPLRDFRSTTADCHPELDVAAAAMALAPGELAYARVDFIEVQGQATLMELELIEPALFLRTSPGALDRCVDMVESRLLE